MSNLYPQEKKRDPSTELEVKPNLWVSISQPNSAVQLSLIG